MPNMPLHLFASRQVSGYPLDEKKMVNILICKICGAENHFKDGDGEVSEGRCENCDNDLLQKTSDVPSANDPFLLEKTINAALAKLYLFSFISTSILYCLSYIGVSPNLDALGSDIIIVYCLMTIPISFHLTWYIWTSDVDGVYKGANLHNLERITLLLAVIALTIFENYTLKSQSGGDDKPILTLLMSFSLILFYTHYFGKKRNYLFYKR